MPTHTKERAVALTMLSVCALVFSGQTSAVCPIQSDEFKAALFHLGSKDRNTRIQAVIDLGLLGKEGNKAAPELIRLLASDDVLLADAAENALISIGPAASRRVSEGLSRDGSSARTARVLLKMGKRGRIRLDRFLDSAEPSDALAQVCAVVGKDALDPLLSCIRQESTARTAVRALAEFDSTKRDLDFSDLSESQRRWASWATGQTTPQEAELIDAFASSSALERELAARVLETSPSLRKGALLEALLSAIDDSDEFVRNAALESIGVVPLECAEGFAKTELFLDSEDRTLKRLALSAHLATQPDDGELSEVAFEALHELFLWGYAEYTAALTGSGPRAVDVFLEALETPVDRLREAAINGLYELEVPDKRAIEMLKAIAVDESDSLRKAAGIAWIHLEDLPPVYHLRMELDEATGFDRDTVLRKICRLGADAEPFLDELIDAALNGGPRVRNQAADTLRTIGQPAFDAMVQQLSHPTKARSTAEVMPILFGEPGLEAIRKTILESPVSAHTVALIPELKAEGFPLMLIALNDEAVQKEALWGLRRLSRTWPGPRDQWPLRAVKDADLRLAASWILITKEPRPQELLDGLSHANALVRESAAYAISVRLSNGPTEKAQFISALTGVLDDESPGVQRTSAWAIGRLLGSEPKSPIGIPGSVYDHVVYPESVKPRLGSASRAVFYLLGTDNLGRVPQYEGWHRAATWQQDEPIVREAITLDLLPEGYESTIARLLHRAVEADKLGTDVTRSAIFALHAFGTGCTSQITELKRILGTEHGHLAASAMLTMGAEAGQALAELDGMIDSTEYPVTAVLVIANIRTPEAEVVVDRLLKHENQEIAAWTVAAIGTRKELSPDRMEGLRTAYRNGVDIAAGPLSRFGAESVDIFMEMLGQGDRTGVAMTGLREIGPPAEEALLVLKEFAKSKDRFIRVTANRAIQAIEGEDG